MEIRLIGTPGELDQATTRLREAFTLTAVSRPYPCWDGSGRSRLYIDADLTSRNEDHSS